MSGLEEFVHWCRNERETLHRSLEMMKSGVLHTSEVHVDSPLRDTTAESMARARKSIQELDALLAKHAGLTSGG
jgi:hypothetical protein